MAEGLTFNLFLAAFMVGILGFWIASRDLSYPVALFVSFVKVAIPFAYFAWFYDGTWTFLDDMGYLSQGIEMLRLGYTPVTALTNPEGLQQLMSMSGGQHILYGWWNLLGQYLFGEHYYSAVFLNVALTFISGFFFVHILRELEFGKQYQHLFLVFFLLQWDVLVWSSFINLKDTLIMTLTIISLLLVVKISKNIRILDLAALALVFFIFLWIRLYIPFLILMTAGLWMLFQWHDKRKYLLLPVAALTLYFLFQRYSSMLVFLQADTLLFGLFRFPLTPQPWSIENNYSFLLLPSIFHWILFVPMLFAGWILWRRSRLTRLILIYLIVVVFFYAIVPELQGPRQRFQLTFIIAWMQFHFLWIVARGAVRHTVVDYPLDIEGKVKSL